MRFVFILLFLSLLWNARLFAGKARVVSLRGNEIEKISLVAGRTTVLSFPAKPSKVVLGNTGTFAVEYIGHDVAVAPKVSGASTNLFAYLHGRRFAFDLRTVSKGRADEIVIVRDALEGSSE